MSQKPKQPTGTADVHVLNPDCSGPNRACRAAHRAGRPVHVIPATTAGDVPRLVLPTYHFVSVTAAVTAIADATRTAPTVATDDDLFAFRAAGVAHYLPVGWVDPTRR